MNGIAPKVDQYYDERDYLLVSFKTNKEDRIFLGKVVQKNSVKEHQIKFLRKGVTKRKIYFLYPDDVDEATVLLDNIIQRVRI